MLKKVTKLVCIMLLLTWVDNALAKAPYCRIDIAEGLLTINAGVISQADVTATETPTNSSISFSESYKTVNSTSVELTGTASSDIVRGMWYEVRAGSSTGTMVDYGALRAVTNFSITVRHLQLGENIVTINGINRSGGTSSDTMTVILESDFQKGSARPRPNPSEIWFGGMSSDNPSLASEPNKWPFVQQYVDGIMFHSSIDGFWTGTSRADLAALLEDYNMRYIEEMGDLISSTTFSDINPATGWGAIIKSRENSNVYLTDITHDFHPEHIKNFCLVHPEWSENAILEWYTGETYGAAPEETYPHGGWRKAFLDYHEHFPFAKVSQTNSTVYLRWGSYPILGGAWDNLLFDPLIDNDGNTIYVGGSPAAFAYNFDEILPRLRYSALDAGQKIYHFWTDFPWGWFGVWSDRSSAALNREKIRVYEQYLQDNGAGHVLICNSAVPDQPTEDAWDLKYKNESLNCLFLHQAEGGKANKYVFESWNIYSVGEATYGRPYSTVPEDKPGSYSNIAKDAIKFLKGIKDITGALEELTITVVEHDDVYEIQVRNDGDIPCLPVLLAKETGSGGITIKYYKSDGIDITSLILSDNGYVYHDDFTIVQTEFIKDKLLQPGSSFTIFFAPTIDFQNIPCTNKTIAFEAFWNPQDPTGIIRDKKTVVIQHFSGHWPDSSRLSDLALLVQGWLDCNDTVMSTYSSEL